MPIPESRYDDLALGRNGGDYIADTNAHAAAYGALAVLDDAVATIITTNGTPGTWTSIPLPAGLYLSFPFTSITLASGKVIAFKES